MRSAAVAAPDDASDTAAARARSRAKLAARRRERVVMKCSLDRTRSSWMTCATTRDCGDWQNGASNTSLPFEKYLAALCLSSRPAFAGTAGERPRKPLRVCEQKRGAVIAAGPYKFSSE